MAYKSEITTVRVLVSADRLHEIDELGIHVLVRPNIHGKFV